MREHDLSVRGVVSESLNLLTAKDRRKLVLATLAQMSLSVMDLLGVLLVGAVIALGSSAVPGGSPSSLVVRIESVFGSENADPLRLAALLAIFAALLLIGKSLVSVVLTRKTLHFLARRQASVTARLTEALLSRPLLDVQRRTSHELTYALTTGVLYATLIVLGQSVIVVTEVSLLLVLAVGLMLVSPLVTLFAIGFFALVALLLHRMLSGWAGRLGQEVSDSHVASTELIQEALLTYREVVVANRRANYVERVSRLRWRTALLQADLQMVALIPKYVFEVALVVGAGALAAFEIASQSTAAAITTIAVFLVAGSRVVPSILRFQIATLNIKTAVGQAAPTLELACELGIGTSESGAYSAAATPRRHRCAVQLQGSPQLLNHTGFVPRLNVEAVEFAYPGADAPALAGIDISVEPGASLALVGSTGAGKSTLADILLGVLEPDSGTVLCSGLPPLIAAARWPGAIAYVPQDIALVNGTVRSNVALGINGDDIDDNQVWRALERARLAAFLREMRDGLDTQIGEHGVRLSGGQRQRLGIARALYSEPLLLVLDEATSALDAETELAISEALGELHGTVTTITIAHRLATIVGSDELIYMKDGRVTARGTFDEVASASDEFATQARILRLQD